MQGWVKINRSILDDKSLWENDSKLRVMMLLMLRAAFKCQRERFAGRTIELKKGQLLISYQEIADYLKIDKSKVKRIIQGLRDDTLIDTETDRKKSLITIRFWEEDNEECDTLNNTESDTEMTHERHTEQDRENEKEKRSKREKEKEKEEYKNEKKEKKNNPITPYEGEWNGLFEEFWKAYPKKIGKGYAQKCFKRLKVSRELLEIMLKAIEEQRKSELWTRDKGQYIPNPSTWLNQGRWQDCLSVKVYNEYESFSFGIEV